MSDTGRKDMEGKEICGGDVISVNYGIPPTVDKLVVYWDYKKQEWWTMRVEKGDKASSDANLSIKCPLRYLVTSMDCRVVTACEDVTEEMRDKWLMYLDDLEGL